MVYLDFWEKRLIETEWLNSVVKGLCIGNICFEHKSLHKYTRMLDGVELRCMLDLLLLKKDILHYVQDVRVVRGMRRDLSDYNIVLVLCNVRLVGTWV